MRYSTFLRALGAFAFIAVCGLSACGGSGSAGFVGGLPTTPDAAIVKSCAP